MPGDPLDDVADDARYGIYSFITTTEKPRELAIGEDCRQLAEQGDLTSASIRYQQMVSESTPTDLRLQWPNARQCGELR